MKTYFKRKVENRVFQQNLSIIQHSHIESQRVQLTVISLLHMGKAENQLTWSQIPTGNISTINFKSFLVKALRLLLQFYIWRNAVNVKNKLNLIF